MNEVLPAKLFTDEVSVKHFCHVWNAIKSSYIEFVVAVGSCIMEKVESIWEEKLWSFKLVQVYCYQLHLIKMFIRIIWLFTSTQYSIRNERNKIMQYSKFTNNNRYENDENYYICKRKTRVLDMSLFVWKNRYQIKSYLNPWIAERLCPRSISCF